MSFIPESNNTTRKEMLKIFQLADYNKDSKITASELTKFKSKLSSNSYLQDSLAIFRSKFKTIDTSKNSSVSSLELNNFLNKNYPSPPAISLSMTASNLDTAFGIADINQDNQVSYGEVKYAADQYSNPGTNFDINVGFNLLCMNLAFIFQILNSGASYTKAEIQAMTLEDQVSTVLRDRLQSWSNI